MCTLFNLHTSASLAKRLGVVVAVNYVEYFSDMFRCVSWVGHVVLEPVVFKVFLHKLDQRLSLVILNHLVTESHWRLQPSILLVVF